MTKNLFNYKNVLASLLLLIICFSAISIQRAQACLGLMIVNGTSAGVDTCATLDLAESVATNANTAKISTESSATAMSTAADATTNVANTGVNVAKLSWDTVGKDALEAIGFTVGRKIVDQLTQNTISWIKGGFHGNASFAVDMNTIALETADSIAGGMVLSLRNIAVCEFSASYKDDLVNAVDISVKKRPYIYNQKATCPFKESYEFKASDFYSGVSKFGWDMMGSALNDGGNPYGLQLVTAREQATREAEAKKAKDKKLGWSNGFTDIIDTSSCNYPVGTFPQTNDPADGTFDDTLPVLTHEEAMNATAAMLSDPAIVKGLQDRYCKTTTPGKIVSEQLTQTLGLNMERLGMSDNLNKIFAVLIDTLTQKTIRSVFGTKNQTVGNAPSSPVGARPSIVVTTPVVTDVTNASAKLTSTITYAGPGVRVWFLYGKTKANVKASIENSKLTTNISKNAPTTILDTVAVLAPITPTLIIEPFSTTLTGLSSSTPYYIGVLAKIGGSPIAGDVLDTEVTSFQTD